MGDVGIQKAVPYTQARIKKWMKDPAVNSVLIQRKLNGHRMKWDGSELLSSEGNQIVSLPHVIDELFKNWGDYPLDGEAYRHGWTRDQIGSVVRRTVNLHPDHREVEFFVFDRPTEEIQVLRTTQLLTNTRLNAGGIPLHVVPTFQCKTHVQIQEFTYNAVREGYEGSIVRHPRSFYVEKRSTYMMKWKPGGEDEYKLVRMVEGSGKYAGTLGALEVVGANGQEFSVGSFSIGDSERHNLWARRAELEGKAWVRVRYTELTTRGVPPSGVFKCIVRK